MKLLPIAVLALIFILPACMQERKSPHETSSGGNITVTYGRPSVNGRAIFGTLVPYGEVWRAGADEATEITFASDGTFGGKPVKAGTYTLFVIPSEKEWNIILNGELKQWGAYEYDKFKDKNVAEVIVPVEVVQAPIEMFTIRFADQHMIMEWDRSRVSIPVSP